MYDEALLLEKLEQMIGVGKWRHIMAFRNLHTAY